MRFTLQQRIKYHFDNMVAKGPVAMIAMLGVAFLLASVLSGLFILATGIHEIRGKKPDFFEAVWSGFAHVIDPGTIGGDSEWHLRLGMTLATLVGIFLVSSLISIINTGFFQKIQELKKGHTVVIEEGHTVILGWSSKVVSIISELMLAHANQKDSCIVILAETSVDEMKDYLSNKIPKSKKTRIIFRQGNPRDPNDILLTNLNNAKSIIILSPEIDRSDSYVIKSLLAIVNHPERKKEKYDIVVEITDQSNKEITEIAGGDEVTVVVSNDVIAKITVQSSRQSGLSLIYNDLLDFGNVEMYILNVKNAAGHYFRDLVLGFENTSVIGIRRADSKILLNPPSDTLVAEGDQLIVIAEDDDELTYNPTNKRPSVPVETLLRHANPEANIAKVQHTLMLGWNKKSQIIITELDHYVMQGSELMIIADEDKLQEDIKAFADTIKNQKIIFKKGDINSRKVLEQARLENFENIIINSCSEKYGVQEADAITLIALMHLRDLATKKGYKFAVVSEMMDMKNRVLAELYKVNDFIVSDHVISNLLAQLSENRELSKIFEYLFSAHGNEIYLKPIKNYIETGVEINMYEVSEIALAKKEVCIGYKLQEHAHDAEKNYGIVINPMKSEKIIFGENDKLIVLAEE